MRGGKTAKERRTLRGIPKEIEIRGGPSPGVRFFLAQGFNGHESGDGFFVGKMCSMIRALRKRYACDRVEQEWFV